MKAVMQSPPDPQDYYSVIGVSANADEDEMRAAYRAQARRLHPDLGGSAEAMKILNNAYETLSDPRTRRAYDSQRIENYADAQEPFIPRSSTSCTFESRYTPRNARSIWWLVLGADCCLFLGLYFVLVAMEPEVTRNSVQASLARGAAVFFLSSAAVFLYRYTRTRRS